MGRLDINKKMRRAQMVHSVFSLKGILCVGFSTSGKKPRMGRMSWMAFMVIDSI